MPSAVAVQLFVSLFYDLGQALLPFSILSFSPKALGQFTDLGSHCPLQTEVPGQLSGGLLQL